MPGLIERRELGGGVTRVAIVDAQPIVRYGLARFLEDVAAIDLVATCAGPGELGLDGWQRVRPDIDVVLVDLCTDAPRPALDAVAAISAQVPVLVISASRRPADVLSAIHAGASGYLSKQAPEGDYAKAIAAVAAGVFYLSAQLADATPEPVPAPRPRPGPGPSGVVLSGREQETLSYIARGFTHAQTATRMTVSKATVDTYVARIRAKIGVGNKAELALAALTYLDADRYPPPSAS